MAPKIKPDAPTNCVVCSQPEGEDIETVECEACRLWAHLSCAGVTGKEEVYFCPNCTQSLTVPKLRKTTKKPKSDAGTTAGAVELPKDVQDQLEVERVEREKQMAQDVLIRIKRMEMQKKDCEKQLRIEREMQERELAAANELRALKLQLEQEFLDKQLAAEEEFLSKRKEIKQLVSQSKQKIEQMKKAAADPPAGQSSSGVAETPKGILGKLKLPQPEITDSEGEKTSEDDEPVKKTPGSGASKIADGPGKPFKKLTQEQLAARQAMAKQLPKFAGEPEVWPLFISSFNYTTEACGFTNLDNLTRLVECLRGPALALVQSRLVLPDAVPDVIEDLRHMFGRPEKLLRALLAKVRSATAPTTDNLDTFIHFGITIKQLCDHLEVSGMKDHLNNPMLVQELVERLPTSYQLDWVRYRRGKGKTPLRLLSDFLSELVEDVSEVAEFTALSLQEPPKPHGAKGKRNEFVHVHETAKEKTPGGRTNMACYVCKQNHLMRNCNEFRGMRVPERMKTVERLKLCTLCLSSHGNNQCHSRMRCQIGNCRGMHHPLLHREEGTGQIQRADCNTHNVDGGVIFRTAPITLYVGSKALNTLAFLDEGSSSTLMEEYVANKLGVQGQLEPLVVSWTAEIDRHENQSRRVSLTLSARGSKEMFKLENVRTVSKLQLPQQDVRFAEVKKRYAHLAGVQVVDQVKEQPTILIGLDNIHLFAPLESRIGQQGEPIAVRSKLGWTVYGPEKPKPLVHTFLNVHVVKPASNEELHDMMRDQYVLDEAGVASFAVPESAEEQRAKMILETTTKRVGERFETGLLWREDERRFPDSYPMAMRRLQALERKLDKNPALKQNVCQQIADYQSKGYAHKATVEELEKTPGNAVWYLPLNVVLNPRKPDKTRLIWDAAASVKGVSLNSKLLKGPDMLVPLPRVVCRFRERPIALGGDIQEMYHQIRIREEDRQAQRFLFRESPADVPQVFVMDVATFGSACSPSSAQFVKNVNADQYAEEFPEAAAAIQERHYVDDYYDSVDTVEEAIRRANEVKYIHSKGGFNIRNWVSNSKQFLEAMGERSLKTSVHFNEDKSAFYERVLGIVWEPDQDVFCFAVSSKPEFRDVLAGERRPTKRIVLSVVMAQFDPAGFLGPITILGKMLVQDLWRTGCQWDEMIDELAFQKWLRWINILADAVHFKLPRCYFGNARWDEIEEIQLHIFADAGENAYGCVAYFRAIVRGEIVVALVMSRSKVAPLKMLSIPRLELESCGLAARMSKAIHDNHSFPISKTFFWTDSAVVLSWIRSDQRRYKQYVGFRIGAILSLTSLMDWNFVRSQLNIADILTKWGKDPDIGPDSLWVCSQKFILEKQENWPKRSLPPPNTTEELRVHLLLHDVKVVDTLVEVNHFSRWTMLVRTMACVHRFLSNLRRKKKGLPLETLRATRAQTKMLKLTPASSVRVPLQQDEYKQAEVYLLKMVQAESFIDEVKVLTRNKDRPADQWLALEKSSPLYKLTPLVDEDGLIRMEGRTENAEFLPFDLRFPVILPKDHHVTRMIVQHYHQKFGHGYRETIKNELRQRFFILGVNALVRQVASTCVWCKVHRNQPQTPRMAPLPVQRITPNLRPFSYVGVDYLGPLDVSVGRRSEKRWVALFTCFVTRAVHLEVAHGLTSQTCLMAIRRFICRRGPPVEFFSDNGTNFRGACKELVETVRSIGNDCAEVLTTSRTKWTFNPPAAPHMGGVWERLVRSVKEALEALDDGRRLTDEILMTCLAEAEDMINSRPLTYVSQESSQAEALTPNHFLRGVSPNEPNTVPASPHPGEALRDAYKRSQQLADVMWQRWIKEYVPSVNQRTKWFAEARPLEAGDLVYIVDGKSRKSWIRGVVEEPIVSGDGRIRQAWVRTSSGLVKRATARLAVLEISSKPASETTSEPGLRAGGC